MTVTEILQVIERVAAILTFIIPFILLETKKTNGRLKKLERES